MNTTWTSSGAGPRVALLLVLLVCLLGAGPAVAAPADPDTSEEDRTASSTRGELELALTDIRPLLLEPGADLVVRGTIHNGTGQALAEPELRVRAQQSTPISRSLLERWLDPTSLSATVLLGAERLEDPIDAGATTTFSLTVPAEEVPFAESYAAWGPRGLEVTVHDAADAAATPGVVRSFLLWWPEIEVETMPLAVLAAAAPTAPERVAARDGQTSVAEASAARLGPLLTALGHPGVDLAVDPSLLVDAPPVPDLAAPAEPVDEETATPPPPDDAAAALRDAIATFGTADEVHALLWADADTAALVHAGRTDLLPDAVDARDAALAASGTVAGTAVAWPAATIVDAATLDAVVDAGSDRIVVPGTGLAASSLLTYTPSARVDLDLTDRTVPAVVTDERLSALLTGTPLLSVNPREEDAGRELDPLTARQYLLAETAVITRERPADRRDLLLTVPRDFTGDPALLDAQLSALAAAPWLDRISLSEMFAHDAPDLTRERLPERVVEDGEVDAATLDRAREVLGRTAAFAGILEDPDELVDGVRAALSTIVSAAWRQLPEARRELISDADEAADQRRGLVAAQPGSTLNLINETAHIPVSVSNAMTRAAQVQVRLQPRDPRLVVDEDVSLDIPAGQSTTAQVPVHAVGSGDVVVDVVLTAPDGTPIDEPVAMQVRVRADWETVGTAVAAAVLALMLVIGLVRTVRRARRRGTDTHGSATRGVEEASP